MKTNKYNTRKNNKRLDYDNKIRYILIFYNKSSYKYETLYNSLFEIIYCWKNGMVTLQTGGIQIRYNIPHIKTYKIDNQC